MQNIGLFLVFWYGILHAFGPDHLTAITDFSIGKNKAKTMLITVLFALGHGITLFIFAKILVTYHISDALLGYGDIISSLVIVGMGCYLLFLVATDKIHLEKHHHAGHGHLHLHFGREHAHDKTDTTSSFTVGALMGIGGVRGMLITLGAIQGQQVDFNLVLAFTLGVMVVFVGFGGVILYINQSLLHNQQNVRRIFAAAGTISILVGANMFLG